MDESLMLLSSGSRKTPVLPQLISDCSLVEGLLMEKWRQVDGGVIAQPLESQEPAAVS